ncbi:retrovirus-related pol polyprotein from transposon TNT 1-94 [Tanacetum coccineum]
MMLEKEKQVDTTPIDYAALNQLYKDFSTRFVSQTELSAEQAFWSQNSMNSSEPTLFIRPTNVEVPKKLPKVSMVNTSLKKLNSILLTLNVEEAAVLRDLVDHIKANYPLDPLLESALKQSTSASGSQPSGNTKKDKIQQTPSSTLKNKHSKLNANSDLKCIVQKNSMRKVRKPTGKEFTNIGIFLESYWSPNIVLWFFGIRCSKHMTEDRSQLTNFVNKFLGIVKFGNDHVAKIMVAFRQHTCYIRNLEGVDLLTGSRGDNLYTLSLGDMMASSPICLLSKASKPVLGYGHVVSLILNFRAINSFARPVLVRGIHKGLLKFEMDHLCSACVGKSTRITHKPKSEDTNQEKHYLLHMDLCGPMRVASVNGKKYILVIVDDYSRFTWVQCLRSKDEALAFIINFLKMIQVRLKETVRHIRTDNGTEFVNQTLCEYYEKVGISHETSVARSQ